MVPPSFTSNWRGEVFSQCGVQIREIYLLEIDSNPIFSTADDVDLLSKKLSEIGFRKAQEVTLIFGGSLEGNLLWQAGGQSGGFSFNHQSVQDDQTGEGIRLENLSFVLDIVHTRYFIANRDRGYSTVAHELVHVFLNQGHVDYRNLMGKTRSLGDGSLTNEQCVSLRSSPLP